MNLPKSLQNIANSLQKKGYKAVVVGGAVRDFLLNINSKDFDIEVYNIDSLNSLQSELKAFGDVNLVGKSYGVLKLKVDNIEYDFSMPRLESKVDKGHKGFEVRVDGNLSYKEAFKRRDFTINAIGYDAVEQKFIDPFGGKEDLKRKILRHIDDTTFIEDPLRVYRAMQFSARFELKVDSKTAKLIKEMVSSNMLSELPKERVYEEFKKLLLRAKKPSIGLELLKEWGVLEKYFQELQSIVGVVQDSKYHPEGDVWTHTLMALDEMAKILKEDEYAKNLSQKEKLKLLFATLCHDLGKATTTTIEVDGRVRAIGHEKAGVEPTIKLLGKLTNESSFINEILPLVEHHLKPSQLFSGGAKDGAVKRLATKVNIQELVLVAKADFLGRTTKEAKLGKYEAGEWLLNRAKNLKVDSKPLDNIITGKDLIKLGLSPSPRFKEILTTIYNKFINGEIKSKDEAIEYVKNIINKK